MLFSGIYDLPWWGDVLVALALTHVTIASVTIFLHRHQAHRALDLSREESALRSLRNVSDFRKIILVRLRHERVGRQ